MNKGKGLTYTKNAILLFWPVNFIMFIVHSFIIGGTVSNGYLDKGKYFVGNHGIYSEVTEKQWNNMQIHENLIEGTFIPFLIITLIVSIVSRYEMKKTRNKF